ncbi:magnesium and cobalt transport protein CorA, partial [Candidatus Woesearchaeota archaeon CG11_big_fil_rev_8_21_14_0_20_57_5]
NFSNLPGAAIPNGFWVMLIGMVAMVVGMLLFFRKRGWF